MFVGFFAGVAVAYVLFLLLKMRSVGWICSNSCRCGDDGYHLIRKQDKGTLLKQYIIKAVFHNLDVYSDLAYILMVPKYSKVFSILMIMTMVVPMLYLVKRNWKGCNRVTLKWWLLDFLGLYQVYFIKYMGNKEEGDPTVLANESSRLARIYILEDGPQFLLQLTNSMLVGNNWSWIQVLSPFLSLKALSERFVVPMYGDNERRNIKCLVANFVVFVLPTLYLVFVFFDKDDKSPPWARLQSDIRWNVEKYKKEQTKPGIY